jgi:CDGSH-type Zn-finger protein
MVTPAVAQKAPFGVEVEAGKSYWWCACGESKRQPFCDGSHKGGPFEPVQYDSTQSGTVWFCGCKQTQNRPVCDGSHNSL